MLENLYTTKMNSNKMILQKRFTKIRSKSGRLAKMISFIMILALMAALGTATVVLAATDCDGLEHWDKNEAYYLSGVQFSINTNNKPVPDWVKKISGQSGNINVSIEQYAFRDITGNITNEIIGKFVGDGENLTLCNSILTFDYGKCEKMYFSGSTDGLTNNFNIIPDDGRHIRVTFGIDENELMENLELEFLTPAPNMSFNDSEKAETVFKPDRVYWIGNFNKNYYNDVHCVSSSNLFLPYETNYKNKDLSGVDIAIISADTNAININTNIDRDDISDIRASVYNPDYVNISRLNGIEKDEYGYKAKNYNNKVEATVSADRQSISLYAPQKTESKSLHANNSSQEEILGQFIPGSTYCIELGLYGQSGNLLYRWREYVTI